MPPIDYEAIFAQEVQEIVTQALHERGIYAITEDELEYMMSGMRGMYLRTIGELRRVCKVPNALDGVRFRW